MSNIKSRHENYSILLTYDQPHVRKTELLSGNCGCKVSKDQLQEDFMSLYAAVRPPWSPSRYDQNYKQPKLDGVT